MNYLIISGSPKKAGRCFSITEAVRKGALDGGACVDILTLEKLERCHVCGEGWGTCRAEHICAFGSDGFSEAQKAVQKADLFCFITPVYWGEMAESLKCFFDRIRRCEAAMLRNSSSPSEQAAFAGKQVLLVASPGGSGNGMITCLDQMDRFCKHTGAVVFDYIGVNRWNNDYKKTAAFSAAKAMVSGRKAGDTI